jgi:hypothetical protein
MEEVVTYFKALSSHSPGQIVKKRPSLFFSSWGGTYVTRYCGHFWPIVQPQMIDDGDCGANGGMKIGRGNRSTRRKPAPAPLCPPQIPLDQTWARTRAAAVGNQRLTAWAMARPKDPVLDEFRNGHLPSFVSWDKLFGIIVYEFVFKLMY